MNKKHSHDSTDDSIDSLIENILSLKTKAGEFYTALSRIVIQTTVSGVMADIKGQENYQQATKYYLKALNLLETHKPFGDDRLKHCYLDCISHLADIYSWSSENELAINYNLEQLTYPEALLDDFNQLHTDAAVQFNLGTNYAEWAGNKELSPRDQQQLYKKSLNAFCSSIIEYRRLLNHYTTNRHKKAIEMYKADLASATEEFDKTLQDYAFCFLDHGKGEAAPTHALEGRKAQQWQKLLQHHLTEAQIKLCYQSSSNLATGSYSSRLRLVKATEDQQLAIAHPSAKKRRLRMNQSDSPTQLSHEDNPKSQSPEQDAHFSKQHSLPHKKKAKAIAPPRKHYSSSEESSFSIPSSQQDPIQDIPRPKTVETPMAKQQPNTAPPQKRRAVATLNPLQRQATTSSVSAPQATNTKESPTLVRHAQSQAATQQAFFVPTAKKAKTAPTQSPFVLPDNLPQLELDDSDKKGLYFC